MNARDSILYSINSFTIQPTMRAALSILCILCIVISLNLLLALSQPCDDDPTWFGTRTLATDEVNGVEYKMSWRYDNKGTKDASITIKFELISAIERWFGFGIGEERSGSMVGADVLMMRIDNGVIEAKDMYVGWSAHPISPTPVLDTCSDWEIINGYRSTDKNTLNGKQRTAIIVRRLLDTNDTQDRVINLDSSMRFIWAYGDSNNFQYHGSNRGGSSIYFYQPNGDVTTSQLLPQDAKSKINLILNGFTLSTSQVTQYACQGFDLGDSNRQIVMIEPNIQESNRKYVGFFLSLN